MGHTGVRTQFRRLCLGSWLHLSPRQGIVADQRPTSVNVIALWSPLAGRDGGYWKGIVSCKFREAIRMRTATEHGRAYRRCGCRDRHHRQLGARCPLLTAEPEHGTWTFAVDLPSPTPGRHTVHRGGYPAEETAHRVRRGPYRAGPAVQHRDRAHRAQAAGEVLGAYRVRAAVHVRRAWRLPARVLLLPPACPPTPPPPATTRPAVDPPPTCCGTWSTPTTTG
ncbi:hypothetical protein SCOCK_630027 [Actinacidiphila cocklensis]|uniref:Uncharacterized protein n=1 Tax=Actinacidiphila cocklensis TaxID=887465 RepID=A0A9W4GV05_9ACTN|nr:hypothetical protein SCOCK_630027 [Actinacidiphila cocklensis]